MVNQLESMHKTQIEEYKAENERKLENMRTEAQEWMERVEQDFESKIKQISNL